jgi:plasmid stability protein
MTQITIRRLDPAVVQGLKSRASAAGHSMEHEARRILEEAVLPTRAGVTARLRQAMAGRAPASGGHYSDSAPLVRRARDGSWGDD